ncbi:MAG: polymer-forming cytoskeletal protein [Desulfobacterales bacterium]|nr:polymer-forming cytoskeletal protein [Desulfobacterales bacterium]MCP4158988.1 polymer-forming cytoskeletal protein [Deltaproteobacteria bacterium]
MNTKQKNVSIIDKDLVVDGTISCKGKLLVNGKIKGELTGETIIIAEAGSVYSNANVESITIGGVFEGEIKATKELIVLKTGKVAGRVVCRDLIVESGGILNAEVTCKTSKELESFDTKDVDSIVKSVDNKKSINL